MQRDKKDKVNWIFMICPWFSINKNYFCLHLWRKYHLGYFMKQKYILLFWGQSDIFSPFISPITQQQFSYNSLWRQIYREDKCTSWMMFNTSVCWSVLYNGGCGNLPETNWLSLFSEWASSATMKFNLKFHDNKKLN